MELLLSIYVASGLFMALLAVPMIRGWLNPNPYYGFRVRATLDNPALWFPANRYAGWRLLVAGLVIAGSAVLFYSIPGQRLDRFAWSCLAAVAVSLGWAVLSSFLYLRRITRQE